MCRGTLHIIWCPLANIAWATELLSHCWHHQVVGSVCVSLTGMRKRHTWPCTPTLQPRVYLYIQPLSSGTALCCLATTVLFPSTPIHLRLSARSSSPTTNPYLMLSYGIWCTSFLIWVENCWGLGEATLCFYYCSFL